MENGWDIPFLRPEQVGHETAAALAVVVDRVNQAIDLPVGVNCLANAVEAFGRGGRRHRRRCSSGPTSG